MRYLSIDKQGNIKTFKGDFELEMKDRKETRVSRIVPRNPLLRVFFLVLRSIFSDESRVANWTRRWRCEWLVVIDGKVYGTFKDRKQAIEFEKRLVIRRDWQ